jgi:hypothetical protein
MNIVDYPMNEHENFTEGQNLNSFTTRGADNQHNGKELQEAKYQCPMNCEGNKTYSQPGACPVCNMQLVMVGMDEPKILVE